MRPLKTNRHQNFVPLAKNFFHVPESRIFNQKTKISDRKTGEMTTDCNVEDVSVIFYGI